LQRSKSLAAADRFTSISRKKHHYLIREAPAEEKWNSAK